MGREVEEVRKAGESGGEGQSESERERRKIG